MDHLKCFDVLFLKQFGCRAGDSLTHQLTHFVETLAEVGYSRGQSVAVFLDVEKAVWHPGIYKN